MINKLKNAEARLAVIGLGYVGLPLAVEFGKSFIPSALTSSKNGSICFAEELM